MVKNINLQQYVVENNIPVFSVPGSHVLPMYNSLLSYNKSLVVCRTEYGASHSALGYASVSRSPAMVLIVAGPGITSVVTACSQAYDDSLPVVFVGINNYSSCLDARVGTIHELPSTVPLFKSITINAKRLATISEFEEQFHGMFKLARAFSKPVYMEIPSDVFEVANRESVSIKTNSLLLTQCPDSFVEECAVSFNKASRPIIYVGWGAVNAGIVNEVERLAQKSGALIVPTVKASSFIRGERAAYAIFDRMLRFDDVAQKSDFTLAIGTSLGSLDTGNFSLPLNNIWHVTAKNGVTHKYQTRLCECDISNFISRLNALVDNKTTDWAVADINAKYSKALNSAACFAYDMRGQILSAYAKDTTFFIDVFLEGYLFQRGWNSTKNQKFITSYTFSNLGCSLPMCIGAEVFGNASVCLVGDGGFSYGEAEIASLLKLEKRARIIIFNNAAFGTIKQMNASLQNMNLVNPNYCMLAQAYGLSYYGSDGTNLFSTISTAEREGSSYIIHVQPKLETRLFTKIKWKDFLN